VPAEVIIVIKLPNHCNDANWLAGHSIHLMAAIMLSRTVLSYCVAYIGPIVQRSSSIPFTD
jgi:hypothetical protein